jgi:hypothetical protein
MNFACVVKWAVVVAAVAGLPALAGAAVPPIGYTDVRIASDGSHAALVNVGDVVTLDFYLLVKDSGTTADGWTAFNGNIASSTNGLLGDLTYNPGTGHGTWGQGVDTGSIGLSAGVQPPITLDGDLDKDLGGTTLATAINMLAKGFHYGTHDSTQDIGGVTYKEYKLASGITFTVTAGQSGNLQTTITAMPWVEQNSGSIQFRSGTEYIYGDGTTDFFSPEAVAGGLGLEALGTTLTLPEPATMALLGLGLGAMLLRRRAGR